MSVKLRLAMVLVTLSMYGIVIGCSCSRDRGEARAARAAREPRLTPVEAMTIVRCNFDDAIPATGRFEANEIVDIASKISGRIQEMKFDEGDFVKRGDLIVKIEEIELRLALDQAEAELKRREADLLGTQKALQRARKLYAEGGVPEADLDEAQRLYDVARASVEQAKAEADLARQRLADTQIAAPLDGILAERAYSVGELVPVGARIFTLLQLSPIKLEIRVPERHIAELALGQEAEIVVDALDGMQIRGDVAYMNPSLDEVSRNLMVRIVVPNDDMKIRPGMFARVAIKTGAHQNILALPRDAILFASEQSEVFVIEDGVARKRDLKIGAEWRDLVEVLSGIEDGDEVVISGQHILKDDMKVNVVARTELRDVIESRTAQ